MKSVAVLSALVAVTLAQSSKLIPDSNVSDTCKAYMNQLDADTSLQSCTSALMTATSAFSSTSDAGTAAVSSALNNLCSSSVNSACSTASTRQHCSQFYTACQSEIDGGNAQVKNLYETLYILAPMRNALCSKDDQGRYCATQTPKSNGLLAGGVSAANVQKYIGSNTGGVTTANATTFANQNVPMLFISPDLDATSLCTTCTRNVYNAFSDFESDASYGPGLAKSTLLQGQTNLYNSIQSKCPAKFLTSGGVQAAGAAKDGLGNGLLNGAERTAAGAMAALIGGAFVTVISMAL